MELLAIDRHNPRLPYEEALARISDHRCGYVRMEGHSASDKAQLDHLYNVIFPAKDAGTWGKSQQDNDMDSFRRAMLESSGAVGAVLGNGPAAASDSSALTLLISNLQTQNDAMSQKLADLEARLEQSTKADANAEAATDANAEAAKPPKGADKAAETK